MLVSITFKESEKYGICKFYFFYVSETLMVAVRIGLLAAYVFQMVTKYWSHYV